MLRCSVPWGASVSIIICFILEYCQRQKWFFKILLAPKMVSSEPSSLWLLKGLLSNTVVVWGSPHRQDWQHSWGSLRSAAQGCFWRNRLESVLPQWCPLWGRVQACLSILRVRAALPAQLLLEPWVNLGPEGIACCVHYLSSWCWVGSPETIDL